MYSNIWTRGVASLLCLLALADRGHAEQPPLFDQIPDPRTVGSLPPTAQAGNADPLRPSLELPGGKLWLRGEVPSGTSDPHAALRGANASLGASLPLSLADGIGLETKPMLTGSVAAAGQPGVATLSHGVGFALAETLSLALPRGFRLSAEGTLGDRLGIFGPGASAPAMGTSPLAMRAGATLSTELPAPFIDTRLQLGLGISTSGGLAFGGAGANRPYEPSDCRLSLDLGRVGGTPLRVSAPCPQRGLAAMPISFSFRTEF